MNHQFSILALDVGTVMFFIFAVISFISWVANQANAAKKVPPPRKPNPQAPQRNPQVQREIERFLREAAAKQRGEMVNADDIEVVREPARRPPPKRKVVEKPRPSAPRPSGSATQSPSGSSGLRRPGEQLANRHLAPTAQSTVANEHLPQSKAAVPLSDDVSKSVSAHLGVFAAAGTPATSQRQRSSASLLTELRTPQGMRSAIVMQEVLKRPRALRPIQHKPAG
jgi:hypothetical protein